MDTENNKSENSSAIDKTGPTQCNGVTGADSLGSSSGIDGAVTSGSAATTAEATSDDSQPKSNVEIHSDQSVAKETPSLTEENIKSKDDVCKDFTETDAPEPEVFTEERGSVKRISKFSTGEHYTHDAPDGHPGEHRHIEVTYMKHMDPQGTAHLTQCLHHLHHRSCIHCGQALPPFAEHDRPIWLSGLLTSEQHMIENFRTSLNLELIIDSPEDDSYVHIDNLGFVQDELEAKASVSPVDGEVKGTTTADGAIDGELKGTATRPDIPVSKKKRGRRVLQQVVIVFGSCFNVLLGLGFPLSLGALFVDWLETFGSTHAETAVIQSVCAGLTLIVGVLVGFFIRRCGIRVVMCTGSILSAIGLIVSYFATSVVFLIASIGVVTGCGCSMLFLGSNVNVTLGFSKGRVKSLSLALLIMSGGLGMMIFPPALQEMKEIFGWRGALLIMAGIFLNVCVSTLIVTSPLCVSTSTLGQSKPGERRKIKWSRLLNPVYFAYLLCAGVGFGTITATALTTVDFSLSKGLSSDQGIMYLFLLNTATTVCRLLAGLALLIPGVKCGHIYCASYLIGGAALIVLSFSESYAMITACFGVYGFGSGGMVATYGAGILSTVGEDLFPVTMGIGGVISGLSFTTFGIIIGTLYDLLGSYDLAFLIFGCMSVGAAIFFFLVGCIQKLRHHKTAPIAPT